MDSFGEKVDIKATIRGILAGYPFSVGLFRELLQNADDAGATKQIFVLDYRHHGTSSLHDPRFARMQGPALLAYNNANFSEEDWTALQNIQESSKQSDTSKIGKYGVGFRSCYHLTDTPQIVSGCSLVILDPCRSVTDDGGIKLDIRKLSKLADQLSVFGWFISSRGKKFDGTIVRLPLRKEFSKISTNVVQASDLRTLLEAFIEEELNICSMFLRNLTSVEVYEVDHQNKRTRLAESHIQRSQKATKVIGGNPSAFFTSDVRTTTFDNGENSERWVVHESEFSLDVAAPFLSKRLQGNPRAILRQHKLEPKVVVAFPISVTQEKVGIGRLFTYLPLPIYTGFPIHIHALFALTQSRQNLFNVEEVGVVRGTDHSVLMAWNRMLFEDLIPKTWMALFHTLLDREDMDNIFNVWPRSQGANQHGDGINWQHLPEQLLLYTANAGSPCWPVLAPDQTVTDHRDLSSILVAGPSEDMEVLQALATFGLDITQPPDHVFELFGSCVDLDFTPLSPEEVHSALLMDVPKVKRQSNSAEASLILKYLLSTKNLDNLIKLPLIPLLNGRRAALKEASDSSRVIHTLLGKAECDVFGPYDENAIALHKLDHGVAKLLESKGPKHLNVRCLTVETLIEFLEARVKSLMGPSLARSTVQWLSMFWDWVGKWKFKKKAFPLMTKLHLLPTSIGLQPLDHPCFMKPPTDPDLTSLLERLGISFLHADLSERAINVLKSFRPLRNVKHLPDLLDCFSLEHIDSLALDEAKLLLDFVTEQSSTASNLNIKQRGRFRALPIFPLLVPSDPTSAALEVTKVVECVPEGEVMGVCLQDLQLLPSLEDVTYIDGSRIDLSRLLKIINPTASSMNDTDILSLALENFTSEGIRAQAAYIKYMAQHIQQLPPKILCTLQTIPFVIAGDGTPQKPDYLVDPQSDIASLFLEDDVHMPRMSSKAAKAIVHNLGSLGLLQNSLTTAIVMQRIDIISSAESSHTRDIARNLLRVMYRSGFDCSGLDIRPELRWLPAEQTLMGSEECLDGNLHRAELFDGVLAPLEKGLQISESLRTALGWDKPLTVFTLAKQLEHVLKHDNAYGKVRIILKELGGRNLREDEMDFIRCRIADRAWVPVSGRKLAETPYAVFTDAMPSVGFYKITFNEDDEPGVCEFLSRMGCFTRPSPGAIQIQLHALQKRRPTDSIAQKALHLLRLLPADISDEDREVILVPDVNFALRPLPSVCYNDVGKHGHLFGLDDVYIAHPAVDENLAKCLGMRRLGLQLPDCQPPDDDMGEQLMTTIRNKLREYTERQIFTEFFANAADAGATKFGIMVDKQPGPTEHILSQDMAAFQTCPALIIHNDATFSEADFHGIIKTGIGGKEARSDTIGQFGFGALTMFHFTELAMIVSGNKVLFVNPAKTCLPIPDRATLLLPLDRIRTLYPDHLARIDGVFGFKLDSSSYDGTIFLLPLRDEDHLETEAILQKSWTTPEIDQVIKPFEDSAHEFLLFTNIVTIEVQYRGIPRHRKGWTIHAKRLDVHLQDSYQSQIVAFERTPLPSGTVKKQRWNVVRLSFPRDELGDFRQLANKYRLRSPVSLGLAAPLGKNNAVEPKLFSTVPLSIISTLPVHLTAPFILSSDRRQIRLDGYDTSESMYNTKLLVARVPALYLFLQADLLRRFGDNQPWWPGDTKEEDKITQSMVKALYGTHLRVSDQHVFSSVYNTPQSLLPRDAVIMGTGLPPLIKSKILPAFKPGQVVALSSRVSKRAIEDGELLSVDPLFVKDMIVQNTNVLRSLGLEIEEVQVLLRFIGRDNVTDVVGLSLLPLADGSFAVFEEYSSPGKVYYVWEGSPLSNPVFLLDHLVHPKFAVDDFLDVGLNVEKLTGDAVKILVDEILDEADQKDNIDQTNQKWITTFWSEYRSFASDTTLNDISSYPLVPTIQRGSYISISKCRDRSAVIFSDASEPPSLWDWLTELGITVVPRHSNKFPFTLQRVLGSNDDFPSFDFRNLLAVLEPTSGTILARKFSGMSAKSRKAFAEWARRKIMSISEDVVPIARRLPIWPILARNNRAAELGSAQDLIMLPSGMPGEVARRFMNTPVAEYSPSLRHLQVNPLSLPEFVAGLQLPAKLPIRDVSVYKQLMLAISASSHSFIPDLRVPNSNRDLCSINTLYGRDPLFLAAFLPGSPHFVLDDIQECEVLLTACGLKRQVDLDLAMFEACALAIHNDTTADRFNRSVVVFQAYAEELSVRLNFDDDEWTQLDAIRFIPRSPVRQTKMERERLDISRFVKPFPDVVAPNEILQAQHEPIAWTQRALFAQPPNQRIMVAYPELGCPTVAEVVRHLRVLALDVAKAHPSNRHVLHDLRKTYNWLNQYSDDARPFIAPHSTEPLFLNIENASRGHWEWHSAEQMLLDTDDAIAGFHPVNSFLKPFKELLLASGVKPVINSQCPGPSEPTSDSTVLASLRTAFREMRERQELTDVVFEADDDDEEDKVPIPPAHRAFLSACSEHFKHLFTGTFAESRPASANNPIKISVKGYSSQCVRLVLDFTYTGEIPDVGKKDLAFLLEVLGLTNYWGMTRLHEEVQRVIIEKRLITPETLEEIKERAEAAQGPWVVEACEEYESNNEAILQSARASQR